MLGVRKGASQQEIRRAYLRIAFATHPDRDPSREAAVRFQAARDAYQALRESPEEPATHAPPDEAAREAFRAASARVVSRFVEELGGRLSGGGDVEVKLGDAVLHVKLRVR